MESLKKNIRAVIEKRRKEKRELVFAGASSLLHKPSTEKEALERKMIVLVSRALAINPLGVVILGNLPYVDNRGRKEKMEEYVRGARFKYRWPQRALTDDAKAICEARVVNSKGDSLCDFAVGECSPTTIKMSTLRGYQNHMAQTRAENRAFEAAFGTRFRKELFEGISRELGRGGTTEEVAEKAMIAGATSAEEMSGVKDQQNSNLALAEKAIDGAKTRALLEAMRPRVFTSKQFSKEEKTALVRRINERIKNEFNKK